jgi:hypothetical protein
LRLAHAPGSATAAECRRHLQAAQDLYRRALALWTDIRAHGGLKPADQGEMERVARQVREVTAAPGQ